MINIISNQEHCRRRWEKTEIQFKKNKEQDIPLKEENKSITVQLELARNQLDNALRKRPNYEKRIKYLEQQLHAINALLNDSELTDIKGLDRNTIIRMTDVGVAEIYEEKVEDFKQHNLGRKSLIPSDFDDSAEETMETHLFRAASNVKTSKKRKLSVEEIQSEKKRSTDITFSTKPLVTISPEKSMIEHKELPKPVIYKEKAPVIEDSLENRENVQPSAPLRDNHPAFRYPHNLIPKKEINPGKCRVCKKGIGFQKLFYRCQDCNIKCHEDCKIYISKTCVVDTDKIKLGEVISNQSSIKVPKFIVDCIKEIEKRGLVESGLYRVSGTIKEINDLKKKIRRNHEIDLSKICDIHVLTCILKFYLRELSEPLITRQYHAMFLECGEKNNLPRAYKLIDSLPIENRHTLAYIFIHFRKVARVQENLMDFKALARVLGPTIIGHGVLNPTNKRMYDETRIQPMLMELLFGISDDFWNILLENNNGSSSNQKNQLTSYLENDKSKTDTTLTSSPLLGYIDGIHSNKRRAWQPQYPVTSKNLIEKLGKK
ncbi:hypothetical protein HZS_499, partial [Henneguya salminicola]